MICELTVVEKIRHFDKMRWFCFNNFELHITINE